MRAPRRRRKLMRVIASAPEGTDLVSLAERVQYVGSPEHKDSPSFAGQPRPRADATICDRSFVDRLDEINEWLMAAIRIGCVGAPWEEDFPRYAWYKDGDVVYEARLVNKGLGQYKGYAIQRDEWPDRIEDYYE
jgi:hypothetical protein